MTERAPQHLLLPDRLRAEIIAHARETFPEECCGLLVGRRAADGALVAENTVRATNVAVERRQDRFELDPAVHLRVQRELRGSGLGVIGHYHSHPGGRAAPSDVDRANIHDPHLAWLIVAIDAAGVAEIAAFHPEDGDFRVIQLTP